MIDHKQLPLANLSFFICCHYFSGIPVTVDPNLKVNTVMVGRLQFM